MNKTRNRKQHSELRRVKQNHAKRMHVLTLIEKIILFNANKRNEQNFLILVGDAEKGQFDKHKNPELIGDWS